jgi:hypothetical protein
MERERHDRVMDASPTDVSYVAVRRPNRKPGEIPDYQLDLYQELEPGVSEKRGSAHLVGDARFGILLVDNAFEHSVHRWLERKVERFRWEVRWHDTLEAAQLDLAERIAAEH